MLRRLLMALIGLLAMPSTTLATPPPKAPSSAPNEVVAAAPEGTTLLSFLSSGEQPNGNAVAVFETQPDKDDVRHRTLVMFGKKEGKFVPEFSSGKLIACSKCSQFHDDPFYPSHVNVTPEHAHIDQFDAGEQPSTTILDLAKKQDGWHVMTATRETFEAGQGEGKKKNLTLPSTGLAKDMDAQWSVPWYLNTVLLNQKNGRAMFLHGQQSMEDVWKSVKEICTPTTCTVLGQQRDGCISLAQDTSLKFYPGMSPDPKQKKEARDKAIKNCLSSGGANCKEYNTECTRGIL